MDGERMRRLLLDEQRDTLALTSSLGADIHDLVEARRGDNSDDEHDPEGATLAFERSQSDALLKQSEQRLAEITAALARLDAGTFGVCTGCGGVIPEERLEIRPYAGTCVACAATVS